jgi:polyisoprenoid-binding protein YceI
MTMTTKLSELTGDYVLEAERTRIGFVARHRMGTRVRGRFAGFEGVVRLDGDDPGASSARITIQADTVDTGNERRDAQLTKDFLVTATYPAITFVSTKVEQTGATTFDVTGDLTIRGVTHRIAVPFELTEADGDVTFKATRTINRMHWQVNWNAVTTALVSPDVILDLQLTASRR